MDNEEKLIFTVKEATQKLGLSKNSAYNAIQRGEIPSIRIGRRILIPKVAIDKLLENAGR